MNYDANKLPLGKERRIRSPVPDLPHYFLGKLAKSTILNGFSALKVIDLEFGNTRS